MTSLTKGNSFPIGLPYTVYAVSLIYRNKAAGVPMLVTDITTVAGNNPMTEREAVAVATVRAEDCWDEDKSGPMTGWKLELSSYAFVVFSK